MTEKDLRVIDKDNCPKEDNIIFQGQCAGCKYYMGFEMRDAQPCVKCDYYNQD